MALGMSFREPILKIGAESFEIPVPATMSSSIQKLKSWRLKHDIVMHTCHIVQGGRYIRWILHTSTSDASRDRIAIVGIGDAAPD